MQMCCLNCKLGLVDLPAEGQYFSKENMPQRVNNSC